jgi:hypothetical protein
VDTFSKGDLVRWVIGHATFAAYPEQLVGADPIYKYGIIMQVSSLRPTSIVVHAYGSEANSRMVILDGSIEDIEVLSKGEKQDG